MKFNSIKTNIIDRLTKTAQQTLLVSTTIILSLGIVSDAQAAKFADFLFVVDESGSMAGEHTWLGSMISDLEAALQRKGVGTDAEKNRYGLVGFGGSSYSAAPFGRSFDLDSFTPGIQLFGTDSMFSAATNQLVTRGGYEDGYQAIDFGLNNYSFRQGAAINVVLVTDEDRDFTLPGSRGFTFDRILNTLNGKNALLNAVVNHGFADGNGMQALGVDSRGNAFIPDSLGAFTTTPDGIATSGLGTTKTDYIDLAWKTGSTTIGGAAWDLNALRKGGDEARSFTKAFVEIKAEEAKKQAVPEPNPVPGLVAVMFGVGALLQIGRQRKALGAG